MAKRSSVGKGDYSFPQKDNWQAQDFVLGLLSLPFVLWAIFNNKYLKYLDFFVLDAALDALSIETAEHIRKKQIATVALSQRSYYKSHTEVVLLRWRPWGFFAQRKNALKHIDCEASILATVSFRSNGTIVHADLICAWGVLSYIEFDTDTYEFEKSRSFELLEVDSEPVAIDQRGQFIRSLA